MRTPIRILLVDDHSVVRLGVRALLEAQPDFEVVGEAGHGEEAISLAAQKAPDVVVLDLLMPGLSGVETAHRLTQASPRAQVVILTSHHDDAHVLPALRAGALSYLLKSASPEELVAAIRKAARGEAVLASSVTARVVRTIRQTPDEASFFRELSEREVEVLRLLANGQSNAGIAVALQISEKTVKTHVSNILGKLGVTDRTQAAALAWREGLMKTRSEA